MSTTLGSTALWMTAAVSGPGRKHLCHQVRAGRSGARLPLYCADVRITAPRSRYIHCSNRRNKQRACSVLLLSNNAMQGACCGKQLQT